MGLDAFFANLESGGANAELVSFTLDLMAVPELMELGGDIWRTGSFVVAPGEVLEAKKSTGWN